MANEKPTWCKDAIATALGWAHPITGEHLVARNDLEDPVSYYNPNAGKYSFLNPEDTGKTFTQVQQKGTNRFDFVMLSSYDILWVNWDFGDGTTLQASTVHSHVYAEDGLYTVSASTQISIDGVTEWVTSYLNVQVGEAIPDIVPDLSGIQLSNGPEGDQPSPMVGQETGVGFSWNGESPNWQTMTDTYEWYLDGVLIDGATTFTYTPVESDVGKVLTVKMTVTNSAGSDTETSEGQVVVAAV